MNILKHDKSFQDRIHLAFSCKDCDYINKVDNAGSIIDNYQIMHNGIKILKDCYYGEWMSDLIELNKGHHEPQEEKAFYEVLKQIPANATMIELGSYWSFYSIWFNKIIKDAINYMVEPDINNLEIGKSNFKLNNIDNGTFINSGIPIFKIDKFVEEYNIKHINILHSDIQFFEYHMLLDSINTIKNNIIDFIFISTHTDELHIKCLKFFNDHNIKVLCEHSPTESYSVDGLIVGKCNHVQSKLNEIIISKNK